MRLSTPLAVTIFTSSLISKLFDQEGPLSPTRSSCCTHIHDGFVADDVREAVDLSEELRLRAVDVLSLPEACSHHRGANVHKNASGKNACQSLLNGGVHILELPLQVTQVALYAR